MDRLLSFAQESQTFYAEPRGIPEEVLIVIAMGICGILALMVFVVVIPVALHRKNEQDRERTKREIAAYAAEGSLTAEEATQMIKAAEKPTFDYLGRRT